MDFHRINARPTNESRELTLGHCIKVLTPLRETAVDIGRRGDPRWPMWDMMFWLLILALAAVIIVLGGVAARSFLSGQSPASAFFGPKPDPRIYVTEQASIDGRRKLLLIRRDDVEHLIMTGGPVDMVIETGISGPGLGTPVAADRTPAKSYTTAESQARAFGQRSNGTDG